MKYWHIRGNKDDLRCSLVSMLILYETCFNPPWIVPVRVTKLPTTFFMFTKVPSTYLDQWLALSINFPRDLILRHLLPDYLGHWSISWNWNHYVYAPQNGENREINGTCIWRRDILPDHLCMWSKTRFLHKLREFHGFWYPGLSRPERSCYRLRLKHETCILVMWIKP